MSLDAQFIQSAEAFLENYLIVITTFGDQNFKLSKQKKDYTSKKGQSFVPEKFYRVTLHEDKNAILKVAAANGKLISKVANLSVIGPWEDAKDNRQPTLEEEDKASPGFKCYWLPFVADKTKRLYLGSDCKFMFTANMDGCTFGIGHKSDKGVMVAHSNEYTIGKQLYEENQQKVMELSKGDQKGEVASTSSTKESKNIFEKLKNAVVKDRGSSSTSSSSAAASVVAPPAPSREQAASKQLGHQIEAQNKTLTEKFKKETFQNRSFPPGNGKPPEFIVSRQPSDKLIDKQKMNMTVVGFVGSKVGGWQFKMFRMKRLGERIEGVVTNNYILEEIIER